jgi:hypothetical protein
LIKKGSFGYAKRIPSNIEYERGGELRYHRDYHRKAPAQKGA